MAVSDGIGHDGNSATKFGSGVPGAYAGLPPCSNPIRIDGSASNSGQRRFVGVAGESILERCDPVDAPDRRGEHGRDRVEGRDGRDLLGHVELQELEVATDHGRRQRLGVQSVHHRHVEVRRAGELVEHRREVAAGLLVLPSAGEEDRHRDLVDEGDRRERVAELRRVVRVVVDLFHQVRVLQSQLLVLGAHGVAGVGSRLRPLLTERLRLVDPLLRPRDCESGVEDAARIQGRPVAVVEHRQRRDRVETRWLRCGDEQLGDAGIRDADHSDLVVEHPRLGCDGFDRVVPVEALDGLEEAVRATAAARSAHVDPDVGEAHRRVDLGQLGTVGIAGLVAAVLDDRRVRALVRGSGENHVGAQCCAISGGDVAEPALGELRLAGVEVGRGIDGRIRDRDRVADCGAAADGVPVAGFELAEQQRALLVDGALGYLGAGALHSKGLARRVAEDRDLFGARLDGERGLGQRDRGGRCIGHRCRAGVRRRARGGVSGPRTPGDQRRDGEYFEEAGAHRTIVPCSFDPRSVGEPGVTYPAVVGLICTSTRDGRRRRCVWRRSSSDRWHSASAEPSWACRTVSPGSGPA